MSTPRRWPLWLATAAAVPAAFVVAVALFTPSTITYEELARDETARCLRAKGDGAWRASSGVTLDAFCRARGTASAMEQLCRDHPERC